MLNTVDKFFLVVRTISNFPTAVLDRLGFLKGNVVYKLRGKKLQFIARVGTEDLSEIAVVSTGSEYNMDLIRLSNNPTIVDLGGHIGTFSIPLAKSLNGSAKIYTVEPDRNNFALLNANITLNNVQSVTPLHMAISDYIGKGNLKNDTNNTDAFYLGNSGDNNVCTVNTLRNALSPFDVKKIDLLKMDIEGGEYAILLDKRSFNYIKKHVNYIFMEFHTLDKKHNLALIKKIIKNDFKILNSPKNVLVLKNKNILN
jgi:FkbM family methyltransferase